MAALNPSVQERVEREVKAYDQEEVSARSLRLQTRFQHRDSARGRSDRPVFVPHAAPLLDAAGRPGLDEDEGLRRPGNPAPARTVRINLTAASRQRIQSGATLLADRLRLRRRSRQRNAIAKALAHEAVGGFLCRERSVDLIEQSAVLVRSRDGAVGEGGKASGRMDVGAMGESGGR